MPLLRLPLTGGCKSRRLSIVREIKVVVDLVKDPPTRDL